MSSADQLVLDVGLPDSDWRPPMDLPDRLHGTIALDLETRDKGLEQGKGPGWAWHGGGHVVGYAVRADNFRGYLPIRHQGGGNLDEAVVHRWLRDVLSDDSQPKVGAKFLYDLGWCRREGVEVRGPCHDVQWAEALLDEHRRSYSLDSIAKDRIGRGKDETLLKEAAAAYRVDPKSGLWRLPANLVGPYGEGDVDATLELWEAQNPALEEEGLWELYELERRLMPLYLDMRWRGVRVDVDRAEQLRRTWKTEIKQATDEIHRLTGVRANVWAPDSVAQVLHADGVECPKTATGKTSVTQGFLERLGCRTAQLVLQARQYDKLVGTFLDGQLLGHLHDGRVHAEFHPLPSDDGGTVGGRGSMSNPNLQFIPARTEAGKQVRSCFLPEEGEEWASADYSQQEPRLMTHFAYLARRRGQPLPGAADAVRRYHEDPDMSYHEFVAELAGIDYKSAKILNLAMIYGRGVDSTAPELGRTREETIELFDKHKREIPFAPALSYLIQDVLQDRGYIRTLLGRKCRFPYWEPRERTNYQGTKPKPLPYEIARNTYPGKRLKRAWLHKGLNRLVQGSAADQIKKAMLDAYEAGYGPRIMIQVHDELAMSVSDRRQAREVGEIMREAVPLEVPVKVDVEFTTRWVEI